MVKNRLWDLKLGADSDIVGIDMAEKVFDVSLFLSFCFIAFLFFVSLSICLSPGLPAYLSLYHTVFLSLCHLPDPSVSVSVAVSSFLTLSFVVFVYL